MALDHAILVSLAEKSASGYDLARRFDKSIGFFRRATHQQIYRVLSRMETRSWISPTTVEQHGRPAKKLYSVTEEGRAELTRWTSEPTEVEYVRSDFAVKVRGMSFGDGDAVIGDIVRQRDAHAERLAYYRADCAKHYPDPAAIPDAQLPAYLVLRGGIRTEQTYVDWCDEMLDVLATERTDDTETHRAVRAQRTESAAADHNASDNRLDEVSEQRTRPSAPSEDQL